MTCVSGSSPAYVYMFIEALADSAVKYGMSRNDAIEFAAMTVKGAADMVLTTKEHPAVLKTGYVHRQEQLLPELRLLKRMDSDIPL